MVDPTSAPAVRGASPAPPVPASPAGTGGVRSVHLFDRLAVVVKYYKIVLVVFVLVVAGMMYQTYTTIPMYRAEARIHIEEEHTAETNIKEPYIAYTDPEAYFQTQYKILAGRDLAGRAARRLNLQYVPEFNGTGAPPTRLTRISEGISARINRLFRKNRPKPAPAVRDIPIDQLIDAMLPQITVTPVRGSRLVDLAFTSADPEFAAKAANILAEEYVAQNLEFRVQNSDKTLQFLEAEVERQARLVQESEQKLAEYREDKNAVSLDDRQNIVVSRLNQLNDAVTRARTQRVQREALYRQVSAAKDRETLTAIVQNPLVQNLKARLAELERERARLSERYGDKHPEIQRVASQIVDSQRQIDQEVDKTAESVKNDYEAALAEERSLSQDLEAQKEAALDLNRKSIDYSVLQRQAESNRAIYDSLLQRAKEFNVINNSRANNVRVLDKAQVPGGPFTPDIRRGWMMAMLFGLGLGIIAAFAIDYLDDTIKTPEDITWRLKLQFLGLVPRVRGDRHPLLTGPVPHDFGEAFRALRTALIMSSAERGTRVQVFTSAQPLEGKTTTAVNVALALAIGGARVLLIDADMRRPSLHKALRVPNDKGLSELLTGQAKMREVVQRSPDSNLLVITAGSTPPNPSELLGSDAMRTFVQQLGVGPFDWVIIDTPPILAVTDAVILAPVVSGVTFVLGAEMTRWRLAERAIDTLQAGRPKSISAVLNRVDFERNRYYYARYYGQQFQSYYAETPAAS